MKRLIPVENRDGLYRDSSSGAILNNDNEAYMSYKMKRLVAQEKRIKEIAREREINILKQDVKELKETSKKILNFLEKMANGTN